MVDDLYRISWELGVIVLLGVVDVGEAPIHALPVRQSGVWRTCYRRSEATSGVCHIFV